MEKTFQIYYTSDTHGHVFPVNYASNSPENAGLLNLAAQVEKDGNTLVLDGGDALQGTPLTQYYLEHRGEWPIHPVPTAFHARRLAYSTMANPHSNHASPAPPQAEPGLWGVAAPRSAPAQGGPAGWGQPLASGRRSWQRSAVRRVRPPPPGPGP